MIIDSECIHEKSLLSASSKYIGFTEGYFFKMKSLAYPKNSFFVYKQVIYFAASIISKASIFSK